MVEHNSQLRKVVRTLGQQNELRENELKVRTFFLIPLSFMNEGFQFLLLNMFLKDFLGSSDNHAYLASLDLGVLLS